MAGMIGIVTRMRRLAVLREGVARPDLRASLEVVAAYPAAALSTEMCDERRRPFWAPPPRRGLLFITALDWEL